MTVPQIMSDRRTFSFEVFPPKTETGFEKLCSSGGVIDKLISMNPDYISCTYGVGGTNAGRNSDVIASIKSHESCIPMTHYTCIGRGLEESERILKTHLDNGINHVLALRGDKPLDWTERTPGMKHSSELVSLIREKFGNSFTVAVGGYPEGHVECESFDRDIEYLKMKQDLGADYIITQLCWDMDQFKRWLEAIRKAGITLPIDVGIMPVTAQTGVITQSLSRNACVMDRALCEIITKYWIFPNPYAPDDPDMESKKEDFRKAGLDYTVSQIESYKQCDINGYHLFAMNKYEDVAYVAKNAGLV